MRNISGMNDESNIFWFLLTMVRRASFIELAAEGHGIANAVLSSAAHYSASASDCHLNQDHQNPGLQAAFSMIMKNKIAVLKQ